MAYRMLRRFRVEELGLLAWRTGPLFKSLHRGPQPEPCFEFFATSSAAKSAAASAMARCCSRIGRCDVLSPVISPSAGLNTLHSDRPALGLLRKVATVALQQDGATFKIAAEDAPSQIKSSAAHAQPSSTAAGSRRESRAGKGEPKPSGASASVSAGPDGWLEYDPVAFAKYYRWRPFQVALRGAVILWEFFLLRLAQYTEPEIGKRAVKLRLSLIRLGPFFVKLGQALSTRHDALPGVYCVELAKLQDRIPPFPTPLALRFIEEQLGAPADELFDSISPEPIAAASLGQVYKAKLHGGEDVAVKVQRPGLAARLALDAHLLRRTAHHLQKYVGARSNLVAIVDEVVGRMFEEVDYVREGHNAERFARLFATSSPPVKKPKTADGESAGVKVPAIYWQYTSRSVLTMEWVDGIKLTDRAAIDAAALDTTQLIEAGVLCSLRQLLEEGYFHADPHPGNLVVTPGGQLVYFDFGMMSEMRREYRIGLIRTLVHFVNRDAAGMAEDFETLGFLPHGTDLGPVARALKKSFGDPGSRSNMDFQSIILQLSSVMYDFNFRLPAEFSMVIRALGSLEGTATSLDPHFKVVASAYPYVVGRLLADADPAMRGILRELLIRHNGSFRWLRLERLVAAVDEQDAEGGGDPGAARRPKSPGAGLRASLDPRAIVAATADLLEHVMSSSGTRVRTWLVRDAVTAADRVLGEFLNQRLRGDATAAPPHGEARSTEGTAGKRANGGGEDEPQGGGDEDAPSGANVGIIQRMIQDRWIKEARLGAVLGAQNADSPASGSGSGGTTGSSDDPGPSADEALSKGSGGSSVAAGAKEEVPGSEAVPEGSEREATRGPLQPQGAVGGGTEPGDGKQAAGGVGDAGGERRGARGRSAGDEIAPDPEGGSLGVRIAGGVRSATKAIKSAPELWLPLVLRTSLRPEARDMGLRALEGVSEVCTSKSSEAMWVAISKQLRRSGL